MRVYTLSGKLCPKQETIRLTAVRDQHALMECSWKVQSGYFRCGIPRLEVRRSPALKLSLSARSREKGLRISSRGQWERIKQRTTLVKHRLGPVHSILSDHFHQEPNYIRNQSVEVTSKQGIRAHDLT